MFNCKAFGRGYLRAGLYALLGIISIASALADDSHKGKYRPMELGVSGGSIEHIISKNRLYCYTGTLGALVTDGSAHYILSNNHVLAKENNPDESALAAGGYNIIQPGLLDEGTCSTSSGNPENIVATLREYVPLVFGKGKNPAPNYVDAALAEVDSSCTVAVNGESKPCVSADGAIKDIGAVAGSGSALLNMAVQKSGRTTGHTFGTVTAIDVDIDVKYDSGTARFIDQVRIVGQCDQPFSDAGDSGSAIVNMPSNGQRLIVGLLFAGGGSSTFANHIADVLTDLGDPTQNENATSSTLGVVTCSGGCADIVTDEVPPDYCTVVDSSGPGNGRGRPFYALAPLGLSLARDIKARHSAELFANASVVGHGVGIDSNGDPVIEVYVSSAARRGAGQSIPASIEGVAVRVVVTGDIIAY